MQEDNPYRAPGVDVFASPDTDAVNSDCWRDGSDLVVRHEGRLPPRCIKCNAPAQGGALSKRFYWHHPAIYLLILVNVLIYALVGLVVRKSLRLHLNLCDQHARRRRACVALAWAALLLGFPVMFTGGVGILVGMAMVVASLFLYAFGVRALRAVRIDNTFGRFRGCSETFMRSLPRFAERTRRV